MTLDKKRNTIYAASVALAVLAPQASRADEIPPPEPVPCHDVASDKTICDITTPEAIQQLGNRLFTPGLILHAPDPSVREKIIVILGDYPRIPIMDDNGNCTYAITGEVGTTVTIRKLASCSDDTQAGGHGNQIVIGDHNVVGGRDAAAIITDSGRPAAISGHAQLSAEVGPGSPVTTTETPKIPEVCERPPSDSKIQKLCETVRICIAKLTPNAEHPSGIRPDKFEGDDAGCPTDEQLGEIKKKLEETELELLRKQAAIVELKNQHNRTPLEMAGDNLAWIGLALAAIGGAVLGIVALLKRRKNNEREQARINMLAKTNKSSEEKVLTALYTRNLPPPRVAISAAEQRAFHGLSKAELRRIVDYGDSTYGIKVKTADLQQMEEIIDRRNTPPNDWATFFA